MYALKENIIRSACASKVTYYDKTRVKHLIMRNQMPGLPGNDGQKIMMKRIYNTDSHVSLDIWYTGINSKIVAFRGTIDCKNVIAFLNDKPRTFSFREYNMQVHSGILELFGSICDELTDELEQKTPVGHKNTQHILFCGHSLGGSLAALSSVYFGMLFHNRYNISCHTFGAPMVGDKSLIKVLNEHTKEQAHVINMKDVIPLLPLRYEHYNNNIITLYSVGNWIHCHDLDTYIDNLYIHLESKKLK
jgi:predicted lipase